MNSHIFLIGGGELSVNETQHIDKHIMNISPKDRDFVFFPAAANDNENYTQQIFSIYFPKFNCKVITKKSSDEEIESTLANASIIYLGGGKTELLMNFFEQRSILPHLISTLNNGASIVGMSAGAQALSTHYMDENYILQNGWGLVPICTFVHATADTIQEALKIYRLETTNQLPFYGISERSALLYSNQEYTKIGNTSVWYSSDAELDNQELN